MDNVFDNGKCICVRRRSVLAVGPEGSKFLLVAALDLVGMVAQNGGPRQFTPSITLSSLGAKQALFALKISHVNPLNRRQIGRTEKTFEDRAQIFQDVFLQPDIFFFERRNSWTGQFRGSNAPLG